MSTIDNINGIYVKDTELRNGISELRGDILSQTIKPLSVTKNGTYTADPTVGAYGYSPVVVNAPSGFTISNDIGFKDAVFVLSPIDLLAISGNTYTFKFALYDENSDTYYPLSKNVAATTSMKMWYRIYVYNQDTLVTTIDLTNYINMYNNYRIYAESISIDFSTKKISLNAIELDNWGNEMPVTGQADMSLYLDTMVSSPVYSISNID